MDGVARLSLVISMVALFVGASCAQVSQKGQSSPPGEARSIDGNAPSTAPPAASSAPIPQPSAPNDVSAAAETDSQSQSVPCPADEFPGYMGRWIDIHSGDIRKARTSADQPPRYNIYDTGLSREVRRLGIPIPEQRQWVPIDGWQSGRMYLDMAYRHALLNALDLLRMLEEVNAPDEQRRDVLQRLLTLWQTGPSDYKVELLIGEVGSPHGLYSPSVPVNRRIEELRYLGSE